VTAQDGHEVARSLRALCPTVTIVGVTGNALAEDRLAFKAAGAAAVLPKPVERAHVAQALAALGWTIPVSGAAVGGAVTAGR
jgi:CheY-like chemotaxis protein